MRILFFVLMLWAIPTLESSAGAPSAACMSVIVGNSDAICPDQGWAVYYVNNEIKYRMSELLTTAPGYSVYLKVCNEFPWQSGSLRGFRYQCIYKHPATGQSWLVGWVSRVYLLGSECSTRESKITKFYPPSGSVACNFGCEVKYMQNGDDETTTNSPTGRACDNRPDCAAQGTNMVWNGQLQVCQPVSPQCEAGFVKVGDSCVKEKPCPDGMALINGVCKSKGEECPAGMTKAPDGTCQQKPDCPAGQTKGEDGTCKPPPPPEECQPGDTECEKEQEQFGGGDTCDVPPTCSGSPIMCGQARIQWRIDCNTRKNTNVSGGPCSPSGMPVCTGEKCDQVEYSQLIMQWRSACAAEKLLEKSSDTQGDNTGTTPTPDMSGVSDAELSGQAPNDGDATGAFSDGSNAGNGSGSGNGSGNGNGLNSSGYGWARSCPTLPTVNLMGQAITFNIGPFCNWMVLGGWLVLLFSALLSLRILSSSAN